MKLIRNTGTDRVIDLLRPQLTPGRRLDVVTPSFSLFAFSEMRQEVDAMVGCRLLLPSASADLALLGSDADRAARNRLQTRWLASRLSQWLENKAEVRRALGAVPPRERSYCGMARRAPCKCFSAHWTSVLMGSG